MTTGPDELEAGWELLRHSDDAARAFFAERLAADPDDPFAHFGLAAALDQGGQETDAIGHYERAVELGLPERLEMAARIQLASALRLAGRPADAVVAHGEVTTRWPNPANEVLLALALHADGRSSAAIATLLRLILAQATGGTLDAYREMIEQELTRLEEGR